MTEHLTPTTLLHETHTDLDSMPSQDEEILIADDTEINNEVSRLYPSVQRVMDELKRMINENDAATADLPHTPSGEPILTTELLNKWAKEAGFGNGKRGTYNNGDVYLYVKYCNHVEKEDDVDQVLATARHLTSLGVIHPESQWSVCKTDRDEYQLFVVSPKLEAWSLNKAVSGEYDDRSERPTSDQSHLVAWFKRVDPNFIAGQPIPEGSPLYHLNWTEASHPDNWGWDKTGTMFPVDVEVLRPKKPGTFKDPEPWKPRNYDTAFYD